MNAGAQSRSKEAKPKVLRSVQWLRGIAAVAVVLRHAAETNASHGIVVPGFNGRDMGLWGVDLFFCISGFIMVVTTADYAPNFSSTLTFWKRRASRVVPLYWLLTLGGAALTRQFGALLAMSLLFATGYHPPVIRVGWTLNYEAYFYVVFGLCLLLPKRARTFALLGWAVSLAAVNLSFGLKGMPGFLSNPLLLEFAFGAVIGQFWMSDKFKAMVFALPVGVAGLAAGQIYGSSLNEVLKFGVPSAFLLLGALSLEFTTPQVFDFALFQLIGDASYSLYVTHIFTLNALGNAVSKLPAPGVIQLAVDIAAAVCLAVACYKFLELPSVKLVSRWLLGPKVRPPEPAAKEP